MIEVPSHKMFSKNLKTNTRKGQLTRLVVLGLKLKSRSVV